MQPTEADTSEESGEPGGLLFRATAENRCVSTCCAVSRRGRVRNSRDACYADVVTDGNNGQQDPKIRPSAKEHQTRRRWLGEWYLKEHTVSGTVSHPSLQVTRCISLAPAPRNFGTKLRAFFCAALCPTLSVCAENPYF